MGRGIQLDRLSGHAVDDRTFGILRDGDGASIPQFLQFFGSVAAHAGKQYTHGL